MRQFIDLLSESQINEVEYQHQTPLWRDLQPYMKQGLFIHFGSSTKVGVKPTGFRVGGASDPHGTYFYSLDWLAQSQRFSDGLQYATNFPYWTIVRLNQSAPGVRLSRITMTDVEALATRNEWPTEGVLSWPAFREKTTPQGDHPAAYVFWEYVRTLGHHRQFDGFSQTKALKGLAYIWDDGTGIIHDYEPNQLITFSPQAFEVVDSGHQIVPDDKRFDGQRYPFVELLKMLRGQYGGDLVWKDKRPTLSFNHHGAQFRVEWVSSFDSGIRIEVQFGRADDSFRYPAHKFKNESMDDAKAFFTTIIEKYGRLAKAKKDMFFTPILGEKDAIAGVKALLADSAGYTIKTEVSNSSKMMIVRAEKLVPIGPATIAYDVTCISRPDKASYRVTVRVGRSVIAQGTSGDDDQDTLRDSLVTQFSQHLEGVHPSVDGYSSKFYYEEDYRAFIGLVAKMSGIAVMLEAYADDITFYDSYAYKDTLGSDIARIYRWG